MATVADIVGFNRPVRSLETGTFVSSEYNDEGHASFQAEATVARSYGFDVADIKFQQRRRRKNGSKQVQS
jgi:hypothetical protein